MQKHFKESLMPAMSLLVRIVVALSITISFTVVAGNCPGARRNMTIEAACHEVCGAATAPARGMYQLCVDTLREEDTLAWSVVDEAGEYAQRAAWRAIWAYLDTMGRAWHFITGNTTALAGGEEERAAYASCVGGRYQEAEAAMDKVRSRLPDHCGPDVAGEYKRALRDVEACRDRVAKLKPPPPPLLAMVEADYNRTLLAYLLGKLIGVK
ncbi:hypothetical protein SEVIR_6G080700v4 [Setaria viridis]|uniref:Pectinesterase inhibitor domain-containing protein n=3 Tax=Setaria TaxID=4554 RepID=A0A368RJN3_SETIT|nr:uncharacterized protein LOC111257631 [Setaria italica]XP_034600818.1 uncharacterized protein LOC117861384 isoform X2 [Setaria viridis]XP_034600819.1 uncharacterized protein LOC117861384 isoform X2 [Setaria viridis]XP_034600820.1 uncharacterized protein LOC117861384 isoform X2 [Setaria viridis]XP_034600821.1 uncharacterized protein LOC117861384 isoform X2 [Setaria viridis]RCV30268.1 hypothetical protein SETIT_6G080700v2 [Setaria italica]TKW09239.1 hypothetical protein SEVIR_6G080700v2 [Seta